VWNDECWQAPGDAWEEYDDDVDDGEAEGGEEEEVEGEKKRDRRVSAVIEPRDDKGSDGEGMHWEDKDTTHDDDDGGDDDDDGKEDDDWKINERQEDSDEEEE